VYQWVWLLPFVLRITRQGVCGVATDDGVNMLQLFAAALMWYVTVVLRLSSFSETRCSCLQLQWCGK
jgi:hypothetical protein